MYQMKADLSKIDWNAIDLPYMTDQAMTHTELLMHDVWIPYSYRDQLDIILDEFRIPISPPWQQRRITTPRDGLRDLGILFFYALNK